MSRPRSDVRPRRPSPPVKAQCNPSELGLGLRCVEEGVHVAQCGREHVPHPVGARVRARVPRGDRDVHAPLEHRVAHAVAVRRHGGEAAEERRVPHVGGGDDVVAWLGVGLGLGMRLALVHVARLEMTSLPPPPERLNAGSEKIAGCSPLRWAATSSPSM